MTVIVGMVLGAATIASIWVLLGWFLPLVKRSRKDPDRDYGFPGEGLRGFPHNLAK